MTSDLLEENADLRKKIEELKDENKKLKDFINAPHTKGRSTTRGDYIKTVWDLSKKLTKAKELIKKFLLWENDWHNKAESKYELLKQAEQFLKKE